MQGSTRKLLAGPSTLKKKESAGFHKKIVSGILYSTKKKVRSPIRKSLESATIEKKVVSGSLYHTKRKRGFRLENC